MSNMSYCRFENTYRDFCDCREALETMMTESGAALSDSELAFAKLLLEESAEMIALVADALDDSLEEVVEALVGDSPTIARSVALRIEELNAGSIVEGEPS